MSFLFYILLLTNLTADYHPPVKFSTFSLNNLKDVHPDLVRLANAVLIKYPEYDIVVLDGLRDLETQKRYVEKGVSKTLNSKHLRQDDGYSHAIDIKPATYKWTEPIYKWRLFAQHVKDTADELGINILSGGLEWGWDYPHFQLGD